MSRPNKVRILNLDFAIQWVEAPLNKSMEHSGEIFYEEQLIVINAARSLPWQADTLLHEIIHALCYMLGFKEFVGNGEDDDEDFTGRISTGLCTVWMNNPDLMSWIHRSIMVPAHTMTLAQMMAAGKPVAVEHPLHI